VQLIQLQLQLKCGQCERLKRRVHFGLGPASASTPAVKSLSLAYANITSANPSLAGLATLISGAAKTAGDSVKLYDNNEDPNTAHLGRAADGQR
jgi:hypothetical protein